MEELVEFYFFSKEQVIRVSYSGLTRLCFLFPQQEHPETLLTANHYSLKFVEEPDTPFFVAHLSNIPVSFTFLCLCLCCLKSYLEVAKGEGLIQLSVPLKL